jgi:hypothetical protein
VGDDLAVAVVSLWRYAGVGATTVRLGWKLSPSTVGTVVGAATCGFIVVRPGWRRLVDSVVDPHEVGVFSKLGDDLSSAYALSLACDRCDRHEALLRGSVYSALDRLESFRKVADGEVVAEAPATFPALPVTLASMLTDKTRIHLRSASIRTYTFFTTGFPRFLSIRGARGLLALNQVLV